MSFAYAVQVVREDGTEVGQVPIRVDWEPARESLRLRALERGVPADAAFLLECGFTPLWDPTRGRPFVAGIHGTAPEGAAEETFPADFFGEPARGVTRRMVAEGTLQKGDVVRCLPVAFPDGLSVADQAGTGSSAANPATQTPALLTRRGRPVAPRLTIQPGSLCEFGERTVSSEVSGGGLPVYIPRLVLDQAAELTGEHQGRETGGILIGNLCRDPAEARLFVAVTAQIPARHTEATSAKLTFTPATWTDVQAALELRNRDEIMLGWWHSHPVREWCKDCSPEKRASCALAQGFLSDDDRLLHRTVFPRAYSVALLVNDVENGPTYSLFGWHRGLIAPRQFEWRTEGQHAPA